MPTTEPLYGHLSFDAFGNELGAADRSGRARLAFLEVAIGRALLHRADRAHAAVALVGAALEQDDLARRFLGAGERAAHHHRVGAGGDRLGDVARVADAAVGDQRNAAAGERLRDGVDRHHLRHADAGDDPRRADRARADADLDRVGAGLDEVERGLAGGDVAADDVDVGKVALDPAHALDDAGAVAVRGVDDDDVDAGADEQLGALLGAVADADRGADAKLAVRVARGVREARLLGDVLDRHQAAQLEGVVDDQDALELLAVHQRLALGERRAFADADEALARRHDLLHRRVEAGLEAQVAIGDDADDDLALQHRKAGDAVRLGEAHHFAHRHLGRDRDRIAQHARLVALDARHLGGLLLRRQVLVDDADAAFLRQGDRQARLGDGVHRRRDERQVEADVARERGREIGVARQDAGERRDEQHVVERQRFAQKAHGKLRSQKRIIRMQVQSTGLRTPGYALGRGRR